MPRPVRVGALGVLEPRRVGAGEADDQDVVPAILVEVDGPREEVVGVLILRSEKAFEPGYRCSRLRLERCRCRIVLVTRAEPRTFPPVRTRDDVLGAVVVEIAGGRPFTPELIAQLDAFERVQLFRRQTG